MAFAALISFTLGACAGIAALLLLARVDLSQMQADGRRKAVAGLVLFAPLLAVVFVAGRGAPSASTAIALPMQLEVAGTSAAADNADWSMLAHMIGGPPPGQSTGGADAAAPARDARGIEDLRAATTRSPTDAQAWLALAGAQRQSRDFAAAADSYDRSLRLDAGNADAWADYADALASAGDRRLAGKPAEAIAKALRLQSRHPKALWLQASLDLEQQRYDDALRHWQWLRAALPAGSPDIAIVEANIAEARQLAAQPGGG
jgi:tetratricopeptide (TPR) repeat protein